MARKELNDFRDRVERTDAADAAHDERVAREMEKLERRRQRRDFPQRIDEDIAENDPVRMVDALVEGLNLESFRKLYKECGRSPYPVSYTHLDVYKRQV